jgi:threonine dehydrogenase-like Zn-dependent dehydrogenase
MNKLSMIDYGKLELRDDWEGISQYGAGMVKVKVSACAICGSDLALFRGKRDLKEERYFGHEFSGVVVDAAPDADFLPIGTRVASEVSRACGKCWNCRHGLASYCKSMNEAFLPGGFADETCVLHTKENSFLSPLPGSIDDITASLLEPTNCSYEVALKAGIRPGDTVAVIGMGPMGFITACILKSMGAGKVVGIVRNENKLEKVREIGLFDAINSSAPDWLDQLREVFGPYGPDVVVELSGNYAALQNALTIVRPAGRIVVGSVYSGFADKVEMRPVMRKELTIVGAKGPYPNLNAAGGSASLDMLVQLQDDLRKIITVYDQKDSIRAFEDMMSGKSIKSVITFK